MGGGRREVFTGFGWETRREDLGIDGKIPDEPSGDRD
jgi:hypothetical protein